MRRAALVVVSLSWATPVFAGETQVMLGGEVPDDGLDHFFVPFEVPAGTVEIEVAHDDLSEDNILDWGLEDPAGFRGWGGGNSENAVVGVDAAPTLDEIADLAAERGLDFVEISDHNTLSQLEFFNDAQERHPDVLFVPGMEFTTYAGHANAIGATSWVDHKIGQPGVTIAAAAEAFAGQGALLSINHPVLDLDAICIGCGWHHEIPAGLAAVEVATTGLDKAGMYLTDDAIAWWDEVCATGVHAAALGGSDDHKAGVDLDGFSSPVGDPTTMVYAESLGAPAILAGIRAGRTVVKLQGPGDPMVELTADAGMVGDTITADAAVLTATVTGAPMGSGVRFVRNGAAMATIAVTEDPFAATVMATAPVEGEDRWRAEVIVDGEPRTITSHLWLREDPEDSPGETSTTEAGTTTSEASSGAGTTEVTPTEGDGGSSSDEASGASETGTGEASGQGCGCAAGTAGTPGLVGLVLSWRRRRRR
jgi:MYXO-CTERM domain-containing protein